MSTKKPSSKKQPPTDVRVHLERAAAGNDTWAELITAWSKLPAAEIAAALATKPLDPRIAEVITGDAREARLVGIDRARDPRMADVLASWICDPPWHATGSQPFWRGVFARLEEIADPRSIAALADARRGPKKIKGASMRGWMLERITRTRDALIATCPGGVPALSAADAKLVRAAAKHVATAKVTAPKKTASTDADRLLAEIYANPADDAPRQVYADLLVQRGDPRGEFINLQLARQGKSPTPAQRVAELRLLTKHVRAWIGELIGAVGKVASYRLQVGPPSGDADFLRFERGFVAGAWLLDSRYLTAASKSPMLSTLEVVTTDNDVISVLAQARFAALRSLEIRDRLTTAGVEQLVRAPWATQLARVACWGAGADIRAIVARLVTLPALRELTFSIAEDDPVVRQHARSAIYAAMASDHLERITCRDDVADPVVFERQQARWEPADAASRTYFASLP